MKIQISLKKKPDFFEVTFERRMYGKPVKNSRQEDKRSHREETRVNFENFEIFSSSKTLDPCPSFVTIGVNFVAFKAAKKTPVFLTL